ncbi:MAG: DUF1573 domain-containing protein, partial [Candidatus Ratteibacteria bacterium]
MRIKIYIICSFLLGGMIGVYLSKLFTATSFLKSPKIKIEPKFYNFGEVLPGKKIVYSFVIKNEGNTPLIVTKIRKSCGYCTEIKLKKRVIPPYRKTEMNVIFIPPKFSMSVKTF